MFIKAVWLCCRNLLLCGTGVEVLYIFLALFAELTEERVIIVVLSISSSLSSSLCGSGGNGPVS